MASIPLWSSALLSFGSAAIAFLAGYAVRNPRWFHLHVDNQLREGRIRNLARQVEARDYKLDRYMEVCADLERRHHEDQSLIAWHNEYEEQLLDDYSFYVLQSMERDAEKQAFADSPSLDAYVGGL